MGCVSKNAQAGLSKDQEETVCQKEFKNLRLAAFQDKLVYHQVNKKHFIKELSIFNRESPLWAAECNNNQQAVL